MLQRRPSTAPSSHSHGTVVDSPPGDLEADLEIGQPEKAVVSEGAGQGIQRKAVREWEGGVVGWDGKDDVSFFSP